jgi:hypothetical protein
MSTRISVNHLWVVTALVLATAAPLAQDRLVINVREAQRSSPSPAVVHYQGTGSVRHSEQRSYASAQSRHSTQGAQRRDESRGAETRRTRESQGRTSGAAGARTHSGASDRHGSVRLDTIR